MTTFAALRTNTEADYSYLYALAGAKSLPEVIELQTTFLRERIETGVEQSRHFQAITTKALVDISKPLKEVIENTLRNFKAAGQVNARNHSMSTRSADLAM